MILPKKYQYEIESHFFCYAEEKRQIETLEREIAEAITPNIDGVGGSSGTSDPTAQKAAQIERETKDLRAWVDVVESVLKFLHENHAEKAKLVDLYYFQMLSPRIVMQELNVSSSAFYSWRESIVLCAAMYANSKNLINL